MIFTALLSCKKKSHESEKSRHSKGILNHVANIPQNDLVSLYIDLKEFRQCDKNINMKKRICENE